MGYCHRQGQGSDVDRGLPSQPPAGPAPSGPCDGQRLYSTLHGEMRERPGRWRLESHLQRAAVSWWFAFLLLLLPKCLAYHVLHASYLCCTAHGPSLTCMCTCALQWGAVYNDTTHTVWTWDKRFYTDQKYALKVRLHMALPACPQISSLGLFHTRQTPPSCSPS